MRSVIFFHRGNALLRPRQAQGGVIVTTARVATQAHPSRSTSTAAMELPLLTTPPLASTFWRGWNRATWTTTIGIFASLAYPTMTVTTLALCDDKNSTNNNNNNDEDFISKIRSKLEAQSFSFPSIEKLPTIDNETIDSIASSIGTQISSAISTGIPTDVSYGFFAGYLSGFALKKIGKVASITLGLSFLALQSLAYSGYIDVHHEKLQKQVEEMLDRNKDGVVDGEDIRNVLEEVRKVAGFGLEDNANNLAAKTGGFGLGFWGGLRSG